MRRWNLILLTLPAAVVVAFLASGCYTQVGTVRNDKFKENTNEYQEEEYAAEDTVSQETYEDARTRFYSGEYDSYPWLSFGYGNYDPWYWRSAGYYYSPYWYDPVWGWCGTYYPRYYASPYGWGRGYDSWYSRGSYTYRTGGNTVVRPGGAYGATRTFGSTRTPVGGTRAGSEVLPSGARVGKGSTDVLAIPRVTTRRAEARPTQTASPGNKTGSRSGGSREGTRSGSENRGGHRRYDVAPYNPPATSSGGNSGGGSSARGSGGSGASAPAPASAPASAPSSSGSHAPSSTGQRGNERR